MLRPLIIAALGAFAALCGCQAQPSERYALGEVLLEESFSESFAWENYVNADQHVDFRVLDGVYRTRVSDTGFIWGLNAQSHRDAVIEVESTQLSDFRNNAYGVMCRAATSNNGDGYYFLISGDGMYSIRRGAVDQIAPLIEWRHTPAVRQGQAINRIRAVCIGDYLALYVNDQFVAETRDSRYTEGFAGLSAAVAEGGSVDVAFDDLTIWSGALTE